MKPCPSCSRRIQDAASKCHYCGTVVRAPKSTSESHKAEPAPPRATPPARGLPLPFRIAIAILAFGAAMAWLVW